MTVWRVVIHSGCSSIGSSSLAGPGSERLALARCPSRPLGASARRRCAASVSTARRFAKPSSRWSSSARRSSHRDLPPARPASRLSSLGPQVPIIAAAGRKSRNSTVLHPPARFGPCRALSRRQSLPPLTAVAWSTCEVCTEGGPKHSVLPAIRFRDNTAARTSKSWSHAVPGDARKKCVRRIRSPHRRSSSTVPYITCSARSYVSRSQTRPCIGCSFAVHSAFDAAQQHGTYFVLVLLPKHNRA